MREFIQQFIRNEEGATAVEYGVLIALIIAICVAVIALLGGQLNTAFTNVNNEVTTANGG